MLHTQVRPVERAESTPVSRSEDPEEVVPGPQAGSSAAAAIMVESDSDLEDVLIPQASPKMRSSSPICVHIVMPSLVSIV